MYLLHRNEFTRPRWYWFDEKAISCAPDHQPRLQRADAPVQRQRQRQRAAELSSSLEDALLSIRRPNRWVVAPRTALKVGENYNVKLSMGLDTNYVPKPLKVNALNNSEWRLASDKKFSSTGRSK
jgi:hypothetical protein